MTNEDDPKSDTSLGTYEPCDNGQIDIGLPELVILMPSADENVRRHIRRL